MLYYAYEHPWMIASQEHWGYSKGSITAVSPQNNANSSTASYLIRRNSVGANTLSAHLNS